MIGIIDYGMGNLYSVQNALKKLNADYRMVEHADQIKDCSQLILPGVGAFGDCMDHLKERELSDAITQAVCEEKKPILGICLGMQALFEQSSENGRTKGFGFLKGSIVKIEEKGLRVPHMGWNDLEKNREHPVFQNLQKHPYVYFVHSYYATQMDERELIAYARYGSLKIPGIVGRDHIMGTQFHPEKSGEDGMRILKYFVEEFV